LEKRRGKLPIIAQEFIKSPSYRVTVIGNKIVQTTLKQTMLDGKLQEFMQKI